MTVHRTLDGSWVECAEPACELLFHFPDMTLAEVQGLPMHVLYSLLELMDPPYSDSHGQKIWRDEAGGTHRDYDLPAVITSDGGLMWFQEGQMHREGGKPARIWPDGSSLHYLHGRLGKPSANEGAER